MNDYIVPDPELDHFRSLIATMLTEKVLGSGTRLGVLRDGRVVEILHVEIASLDVEQARDGFKFSEIAAGWRVREGDRVFSVARGELSIISLLEALGLQAE